MSSATKSGNADAGSTSCSITVVIPTRQRRDQVTATMTTLAERAREAPEVIEAVVVVDGSPDGTAQALDALELGMQLTVIEQDRAGTGAARNRGASVATGEWILFLDDDIVVQSGYLRAVIDAAGNDVDVVLTRLEVGDWVVDSLLSREAHAWDNDGHAALEQGRMRFDDILFASTLVRRQMFESAGGFDESFTRDGLYGNEDVELSHRLLKAGARVRYCAQAIAQTGVVDDTDLILRRSHQVGGNDVALVRKHPVLGPMRFGNRFRHSRVDRVLAPIVLRLPISLAALAPLGSLARWLIRRGFKGKAAYRLWFSIRAVHYWRGVADAGGRTIVACSRRAAR